MLVFDKYFHRILNVKTNGTRHYPLGRVFIYFPTKIMNKHDDNFVYNILLFKNIYVR